MTINASKRKSAFEDGCLKHRTSRRSHAKLVGCVTKSSHATQAERTRANKFTGTIKPIRQQNLSTSYANDGSEGGCGATDIDMLSEGDDSDGSCIMDVTSEAPLSGFTEGQGESVSGAVDKNEMILHAQSNLSAVQDEVDKEQGTPVPATAWNPVISAAPGQVNEEPNPPSCALSWNPAICAASGAFDEFGEEQDRPVSATIDNAPACNPIISVEHFGEAQSPPDFAAAWNPTISPGAGEVDEEQSASASWNPVISGRVDDSPSAPSWNPIISAASVGLIEEQAGPVSATVGDEQNAPAATIDDKEMVDPEQHAPTSATWHPVISGQVDDSPPAPSWNPIISTASVGFTEEQAGSVSATVGDEQNAPAATIDDKDMVDPEQHASTSAAWNPVISGQVDDPPSVPSWNPIISAASVGLIEAGSVSATVGDEQNAPAATIDDKEMVGPEQHAPTSAAWNPVISRQVDDSPSAPSIISTTSVGLTEEQAGSVSAAFGAIPWKSVMSTAEFAGEQLESGSATIETDDTSAACGDDEHNPAVLQATLDKKIATSNCLHSAPWAPLISPALAPEQSQLLPAMNDEDHNPAPPVNLFPPWNGSMSLAPRDVDEAQNALPSAAPWNPVISAVIEVDEHAPASATAWAPNVSAVPPTTVDDHEMLTPGDEEQNPSLDSATAWKPIVCATSLIPTSSSEPPANFLDDEMVGVTDVIPQIPLIGWNPPIFTASPSQEPSTADVLVASNPMPLTMSSLIPRSLSAMVLEQPFSVSQYITSLHRHLRSTNARDLPPRGDVDDHNTDSPPLHHEPDREPLQDSAPKASSTTVKPSSPQCQSSVPVNASFEEEGEEGTMDKDNLPGRLCQYSGRKLKKSQTPRSQRQEFSSPTPPQCLQPEKDSVEDECIENSQAEEPSKGRFSPQRHRRKNVTVESAEEDSQEEGPSQRRFSPQRHRRKNVTVESAEDSQEEGPSQRRFSPQRHRQRNVSIEQSEEEATHGDDEDGDGDASNHEGSVSNDEDNPDPDHSPEEYWATHTRSRPRRPHRGAPTSRGQDETHEPSEQLKRRGKKRKRSYNVVHDDADVVQLKADVRQLCDFVLLKIKDLGYINAADPETVEEYHSSPQGRHQPSIENFRPDLEGSVYSEWNKRLADLFAQKFVASPEYACKNKGAVVFTFLRHLHHLRKRFQTLNAPRTETHETREHDKKVAKAREFRQRSLRHRRRDICEQLAERDPSMRRCLPLWESMPMEVVSGDETDHGPSSNRRLYNKTVQERYAITNHPWRSLEVKQWFRTFDALHMATRFTLDDRAGPGRFPHIRIESGRVSKKSRPVPGLPRNFYNPDFLRSLNDHDLETLNPQADFNLSFSRRVQYIAERFKNVKTHKDQPVSRDHPSLRGFSERM
ncbi:hypothetical protein AB1N83_008542 [Pleurotus pulmonarius]